MNYIPQFALFNLGGGEIVLILGAMMLFAIPIVAVVIIVWLVLRRQNKKTQPTVSTPPILPKTQRTCPQCGKQLAADTPQGLCPSCLMKVGLGTQFSAGGAKQPSPPVAMPLDQIAKLFPQLEILELLGQGGMGLVYKARQPALDRLVALKILSPELGKDPSFAERFSREAKALGRLNHPNIVGVYDFGQAGDYYYFLMEYVDGMNLWQLQQAKQRISPEEALGIVPKICEALQYAHDEGIVHRDIKPGNILIDKKGRVKIADFGLAKIVGAAPEAVPITQSRMTMGTPHYMAPEQIEKPLNVDHRADIYSLGVVFYEMLTGELPLGRFAAPSEKVQVDVRVDEVVLRALEKEPQKRYQQVSEVKTKVEAISRVPSAPPNPKPEKKDTFWRKFAVVIVIIIALVILVPVLALVTAIVIPNFQKARAHAAQLRQQDAAFHVTNRTAQPKFEPMNRNDREIIIDNQAADFGRSFDRWLQGSFATSAAYGPDYFFTPSLALDKPNATATYRPRIEIAGTYEVQIWYTAGANRCTNAPWTISTGSETFITNINQQINGSRWVPIGSANFDAGTKGFVQVANNVGIENHTVIIADAVRFMRIEESQTNSSTIHGSSSEPTTR